MLCKADDRMTEDVKLERFAILAAYFCSQNIETVGLRKALLIFENSCETNRPNLLKSTEFFKTISLICRMASTDMMQAAVDSRYAKELYSNT